MPSVPIRRSTAAIAAAALITAVGWSAPTSAHAATPLRITRVYVNSPGTDDGSNASLNAEYVRIKNTGSESIAMKDYTVRDKANHVYTFGTFKLKPGKSVTLRTGKGSNTSRTRYWGLSWYVWNNTGDTATLKKPSGTRVDRCSWGSVDSYVSC